MWQVAGGVWPVLRLFSTTVALGSFERARVMWPQLGLELLQKARQYVWLTCPGLTSHSGVFWHLTGQPVTLEMVSGGTPWLGPEGSFCRKITRVTFQIPDGSGRSKQIFCSVTVAALSCTSAQITEMRLAGHLQPGPEGSDAISASVTRSNDGSDKIKNNSRYTVT